MTFTRIHQRWEASLAASFNWKLLVCLSFAAVTGCGAEPRAESECASIEILVGFGAGGGTDIFARTLATGMREHLEKPVRVVNYVGGAGRVSFRELMKRPANGCAALAVTSDYVVLSAFQPQEIDLSKLRFIVRAHYEVGLLSARKSDAQDWASLTAEIKKAGKPLLVGGIGARSFDRAVVATALEKTDLRYRYIPYSSAKEMQADLLGGRFHVVYDEYGVMQPLYRAGQAQALVVLNETRIAPLPDAPAAPELGLAAPAPIWRGLAVSAQTPHPIADAMEKAAMAAMTAPSYRQYETDRRLNLIDGSADGATFAVDVAKERADVVQALRVR
ncbi:MAG: tripartite tricarboxylate transporter substrate-binding protein [Pseudomonadota bacterium]